MTRFHTHSGHKGRRDLYVSLSLFIQGELTYSAHIHGIESIEIELHRLCSWSRIGGMSMVPASGTCSLPWCRTWNSEDLGMEVAEGNGARPQFLLKA